MTASRRINACRGFTLVEMLVALTIMAVVLGLLTNSMRFSLKTTEVVESNISAVESMHQAQRALRRQLQMAVPIRRADSNDGDELEFTATQKELQFIAPLPGLAAGGGLYRITLRVENDVTIGGSDGRLMMTFNSSLDGPEPQLGPEGSQEIVLLDGFSDAGFSYLDTRRVSPGEWTNDWNHGDRLPDLVRLRVDYTGSPDDEALDMIVAIKATSPAKYGAS